MSQSERDKNRLAFPIAAAIADQFREVFGEDVRLVYAKENGREIGKQPTGIEVCAADMIIEAKKGDKNDRTTTKLGTTLSSVRVGIPHSHALCE